MKQQSERLGFDPIQKILARLAVPATVGMLVMALHSVIDTVYIARGVGTIGVAAVAISFPVQILFYALGGALGIGGSSVISRALGAKNLEKANQTLGNIISLVVVVGFSGAFFGLYYMEPMLLLFGASEIIMLPAEEYLGILLYGITFLVLGFSINNVVRAEGNSKTAMLSMIMSSLLNIILTPIFMFALQLGMRGAAYGTVMAQGITAIYLLYYLYSGRSTLSIRVKYFYPRLQIIREMLAVGASAFIRQGSASLMLIVANNLLILYGGELAIAVLGIIHRIMMFTLMPILGIVQGMMPIVGFNYGAKKLLRVKESIVLSMKISTAIALFAFLLVMTVPGLLMRVFTTDPAAIEMGKIALRVIFTLSFTVGMQMVTAGVFQALGKAREAFLISMARQILFLIPLLLLLPLQLGLTGIWLAFPLADLLSVALTFLLIYRHRKYFFTANQKQVAAK